MSGSAGTVGAGGIDAGAAAAAAGEGAGTSGIEIRLRSGQEIARGTDCGTLTDALTGTVVASGSP